MYLGKTLEELERDMSAAELTQWIRYISQESLPHERMELQVAKLIQHMVALMGDPGPLSSYLVDYNPKPQTVQSMGNTFLMGLKADRVGIDNQSSSEPVI